MAKDMALQVPSWGLCLSQTKKSLFEVLRKSAWQEVESIPLSVRIELEPEALCEVVKMRGPASEQVKKWGELTLETTDHAEISRAKDAKDIKRYEKISKAEVFCSHHFHVLHCDTGLPSYNHQQKQENAAMSQGPTREDLLKRFRNAKVHSYHHSFSIQF